MGHVALAWLARYLKDVRPQMTRQRDSGHLFVTKYGSGMKRKHADGDGRHLDPGNGTDR